MRVTAKIRQKGSFTKDAEKYVKDMVAIARDSGNTIERNANAAKPAFVNIQKSEQLLPEGILINVGVQTREDDMHAYYEFHTGAAAAAYLANKDPEVQRIAKTYFKTGHGTLRGRPYFFPNFFAEAPRYIEKLKKYVRTRS